MKPITVEGFEAKFRETVDPWNYRTSAFEARKLGILVRACGPPIRGRGLELACAIGEGSARIAPHCLGLMAMDASPTAISEAERRHGAHPRIRFKLGILPRDMPRGPFDLIVMSEIAYYLGRRDLDVLLARMIRTLAPGGRIVVLHHLRPFDDAAQLPRLAQARVVQALGHALVCKERRGYGRFQLAVFEKGRGRTRRPLRMA